MTFASIPHGSRLFLDANTLVYYFTADLLYGAACLQLVDRIARQEIHGFTSAHVVSDVAHRVMTLEAMHVFGLPAKGIAAHLRQQPAVVQQLTRFRQQLASGRVGARPWPSRTRSRTIEQKRCPGTR